MSNVSYILNHSDCGGESYYSNEQFGDWYEHRNREYHDTAEIVKNGYGCDMFPGNEPVKAGGTIYVVIVTYSSGNTFGSSSGNCSEVWAFDNREQAKACAELIRENGSDGPFTQEFQGHQFYTSWVGYFESIEYVDVYEFSVYGE